MYDLDYDAAMLELLRMFLTFLSGLVYGDFDLVFASQSIFALFSGRCRKTSAAGPVFGNPGPTKALCRYKEGVAGRVFPECLRDCIRAVEPDFTMIFYT